MIVIDKLKRYCKYLNVIKYLDYVQYKTLYQSLQYEYLFDELYKISQKNTNAKALDWGGAQGHVSLMLSYLGFKTQLFSILNYKKKWDKISNFKINFDYKPNNIRILPYKDEQFDISISCGVLEHVRESGGNELDSLRELLRVTSKYIIIYHLPNKYSWIEFLNRTFFKDRYSHPFRYSHLEINKLLKSFNDLKIIKIRRYGILPRRVGKNINNNKIGIILHYVDRILAYTPLIYISQCFYIVLSKTETKNTY